MCDTCTHKTDRGCSALTETEKGSCAFHQTPDELAASRAKAIERLNGMPEEAQAHIAKKYYNGTRKWTEVATK